ncbi:DUF2927 domain-containing protein [Actibacterium lipolyticum]|uniref:DUF2927 domain-containing protein n=1 Tax=Actibacterium lipolyticum TaxID=1524263 RepID=A0A238JP94_9RHOB|nr:DUF2927 domain-containing protein [Actibacterium lipolyticum]SMX32490.1 hypothetical protein COL8621_00827 [Actibacterium lipolyticum]
MALGLSGCETPPVVEPVAPPPARPVASPEPPKQSNESILVAKHFARVQADLQARGLLRTDGGGPDTPFSKRQLVENFVQIALHDEYVTTTGRLVARPTESPIRRWEKPITLSVIFGDTVPEDQRRKDHQNIKEYASRLSRITGLPITPASPETANFHVLMLNEDERRAFGPRLRELAPGIDATSVRTVTSLPRSTLCIVFAFTRTDDPTYTRAVAVIRAEHPDLLRLSCIHEELAQGLGLANDSPDARPSIFNDDEEFALLTRHDELLLKMLYDPRLKIGIRTMEARPIVREIADELLGGES